ncbi:outer membrane beta-barrel protein [Desertivirga arenae]|uniref:outer membrane beta-barrel protein n=1 Tax=Desertivirga arenae TaxID=2810309 RepID=UPI001A96740B|nr:outer membrane beta-barrel protein [Pedobacter sp. SYSU D00823]
MKKTVLKFQFSVFLLLFLSGTTFAQSAYTVKGVVQDTAGNSLPGAIIRLINGKDSVSTSTDLNGGFVLNNVKFLSFQLKAAYIGFKNTTRPVNNTKGEKVLVIPTIKLRENSNTLREVVISGTPPIRIKEDTVQFDAKAFKVRDGDAVEEMIKKLPGLTVDKDGKVTAQGKPITKIRVNGKDFFGSDVATAIQNLPADIVQNLQVIDDYGDQAKVTGIKADEPEKILNINIQPDKKKGYFARGTGGMGNEGRYIASVRGNAFKGERQVSYDLSLNNTNIRGGNGNGITNNRSVGLNYKNEWGKKVNADWSYRFNNSDNNTISSSYQQTFYSGFTRIVDANNNNNTINRNHEFSGNVELKFDTLNYLKVSPFVSFNNGDNSNGGNNNTINNRDTISIRRTFNQAANSFSRNIGSNFFFNHKFLKPGRNVSFWASAAYNKGDNDRDSRNDDVKDSLGFVSYARQYQYIENFNDNFRVNANVTYSEPLSKATFLDLRYFYNYSNTKNGRDLSDINPSTEEKVFNEQQSNNYNYQFITNRIGFNLRHVKQKYNYSIGVNAQPVTLKGNDLTRNIRTSKETFNWIPSGRFVYKFTKQKSLTANYFGRSSQPGFNQLQPIVDSTNRNNIVVGNSQLDPEFNHTVNVEYNQSDWKKGNMFFANFNYNQIDNKIVNTRTFDPTSLRQYTTYVNTDGFYSLRGNYSYAIPFDERKYTVTFYGGGNFSNNVGFNNGLKNIAKNYVADQGIKFRLDIKDIMDTEFNTNYSFNTTEYSLPNLDDRTTNRYNFSIEGRNYFFKDLTLGYSINKTINKGFSSGNPNPSILNLYTEYRFLKGNMGALRFYAFDLFNENTGISRDVFGDEIIDSRSNRLGRYFLMSFVLRVRKFG